MTTGPDELVALCRKWQARLRLEDWDITIAVVRAGALSSASAAAEIEWFHEKKQAAISFAEAEDVALATHDQFPKPLGREYTIIHELLHLHFAPLNLARKRDQRIFDRFEEQAIHAIASALHSAEAGWT